MIDARITTIAVRIPASAALKDAGRDGGKIALITGSLQEGVASRRLAAIKEVLAAHPKAQLVAVEDAHWDPVQTERIAGQLLARFAPQGGLDVLRHERRPDGGDHSRR